MRALVMYALVGLLFVLGARWAITRRSHAVSVTIVLIVLVPVTALEVRWRAADNAFSAATRALAPASQGSTCQRMLGTFAYAGADWGHVAFDAAGRPDTMAWLSYDACQRLMDWYRSDKSRPSLDQAQAVHVIPHEAAHLLGERNEAAAECFAVQNTEETAAFLGATPEQAATLARIYWKVGYSQQRAAYRSPDCRENGPMDATPGDGSWP